MRSILATMACVAGLALAADPGRAQDDTEPDIINQKSGKPLEGEVDEITFKEVRYRLPGVPGTQKLALSKVENIEFGNRPRIFDEAKECLDADPAKSADLFARAATSTVRKWVRPESLYFRGEALLRAARFGAAVDSFKALLKEFPEWWRVPKANIGLGKALLAQNKNADALAALDTVVNGEFDEADKLTAEIWKARVVEAQSKFKDAKEQYDALERKAGGANLPDVALFARVRKLVCQVQLSAVAKDAEGFEDARRGFLGILEDKASANRPAVRATAWTGLGEAYYLRPNPDKREALFAVMRVPYLYPEEKDEMPKALYYAAHACAAMADGEKEPEKQKVGKGRAMGFWALLQKDFKGTFWADKPKPK